MCSLLSNIGNESSRFSTVKSAFAVSNASRAGSVPSVTTPWPCHARSPLPSQPDVKLAGIDQSYIGQTPLGAQTNKAPDRAQLKDITKEAFSHLVDRYWIQALEMGLH